MASELVKRAKQAKALVPQEDWSALDKVPAELSSSIKDTRQREFLRAIFRVEEDYDQNMNRLFSALDRIRDMKAGSAIESIYFEQIEIIREHLFRAAHAANLAEGNLALQDCHLKRMERLNLQFIKLVEALDKHRGKANQKVVVEHVNVGSWGQAIVGTVNAQGRPG